VENTDITKSNTFPNKMEINLHMFGTLMLNRVLGHVDGADVVAVHKSRFAQGSVKLRQQLP
jgi:hypothetical protein